ncbi:5-methylcytosine-specific restriction endonuclease McrA [Haloferula luteola]|uniref:5-methylcytosine-specific restriction endonuclease McrA n=1 Tax=Haloferula luteola TaxID=595692 RepID=A0A840VBV6_9BACT|nr:HNH endonuclease [Haloferula luteola]MBB5351289.1 5-methylcytosine-specific restriction endonuclease McrA [Haloferula luteola]
MTDSILHRTSVLVLNRHWMAIDAISPAEAFSHLVSGTARAIWIEEGAFQPMEWEQWSVLDVPEDLPSVGTPRGRIRVPTVILLHQFDRVPMVRPVFGFRGIWERDGGRCQYTGRTLRPDEANIDHVIPRSRGGVDDWENCVLSDRRINTRKGARTPEEAGLRLLSVPKTPKAVPASLRIRNSWKIEDWNYFLKFSV